jgi:hypothetical protein
VNIAFLKFPPSPTSVFSYVFDEVINECCYFSIILGALLGVAGRVVDIDLEKCVISPVKVAFKQC